MKKMFKNYLYKTLVISILLFILSVMPLGLMAQPIDCSPILEFRHPDPSFSRSEYSQSIQGFTGKEYVFEVPVIQGEQYRFTFFISAILTREIDFKIEDLKTGQVLLDLPGTTKENKKNECVLGAYFDEIYNKMVYPYFDFYPKTTSTYKIIIDIAKYKRPKTKHKSEDDEYFREILEEEKKLKEANKTKTPKFTQAEEKRTGCITMYIQKREACF